MTIIDCGGTVTIFFNLSADNRILSPCRASTKTKGS